MKIMERGRITIPKKIRDKYGLKPDTEVDIFPVEEGILIVKSILQKSPFNEVYGILKKKRDSDGLVDKMRGG
ncbi:MAG: AbrB/MazE/SpoVT family DNA-binding domain-containing protein [Spirochaetes bacterium]|nr:AbrB/MazE/SpoVT family DNA-binding domain-containing protein [Spirochaetota bacterium]